MAAGKKYYRADHVGSLLRPTTLLQARASHAAGKISDDTLRQAEDAVIRDLVEKQRQIGLNVCTDGEVRRDSWLADMADSVDGFVSEKVTVTWKGPNSSSEGSRAYAVGEKLKKVRNLTGGEMPFMKAISQGPFKVTLPAPSNFMLTSYKTGITDKVYKTEDELLEDLVAIVQEEIAWLVSEAVPYIQMDAPLYSHYLDPVQRARMQKAGHDPDKALEKAIAGDNAALKGIPRDNTVFALHVCRGNNRSRWYTEGAYDTIAQQLFGNLNVDRFLLEYDTERAGSFEALRMVPPETTAV